MTVFMSAQDGKQKEYQFVVDPTNVSKMSLLMENLRNTRYQSLLRRQ